MQPHHRTNHNDVFLLIVLMIMTLTKINNMLPDDDCQIETCTSNFNVNINVLLNKCIVHPLVKIK